MTDDSGDSLAGTVALVTGGGHGLGRVMAEALVAKKASVLIFDINNERIDEVCKTTSGNVSGCQGDVSLEDDVERAVAACIARYGHLDVVVNNAGLLPLSGDGHRRFADLSLETVRKFFEVHVLGSFLISKSAVGNMIEHGWGRIITVTTNLDTMLRAGAAPYGPAKAALEAFTSVMAQDLLGTGVTANVLIPGGGVTTGATPQTLRSDRVPIFPEVMGPPVVWLASRASDGISARRFVAKDWNLSLPASEAAERAGAPIAWSASRNL